MCVCVFSGAIGTLLPPSLQRVPTQFPPDRAGHARRGATYPSDPAPCLRRRGQSPPHLWRTSGGSGSDTLGHAMPAARAPRPCSAGRHRYPRWRRGGIAAMDPEECTDKCFRRCGHCAAEIVVSKCPGAAAAANQHRHLTVRAAGVRQAGGRHRPGQRTLRINILVQADQLTLLSRTIIELSSSWRPARLWMRPNVGCTEKQDTATKPRSDKFDQEAKGAAAVAADQSSRQSTAASSSVKGDVLILNVFFPGNVPGGHPPDLRPGPASVHQARSVIREQPLRSRSRESIWKSASVCRTHEQRDRNGRLMTANLQSFGRLERHTRIVESFHVRTDTRMWRTKGHD